VNLRQIRGRGNPVLVAAALGLAAALLLGLWVSLGPGGTSAPPPVASAGGTEPAADPAAPAENLVADQPALTAPPAAAAPERVEVAAGPAPRPVGVPAKPRVPAPEPALVDLAATLRLRLVDAAGEPLARRSVHVRTWGGYHAAERTVVADGSGWVELHLGQLSSRPRHAEFVAAAEAGRAELRSPVLQLGPEGPYGLLRGRVRGGDVVLEEPPLLVSGRVVDGLGGAVAGALVELVPKGARDRPNAHAAADGHGAASDADGRFALYGSMGAGPWQLVAAAEGRGTIAPVEVTPGQTGVDVQLVELASASIELALAPWMVAADFCVRFESSGWPALPLGRVSQSARVARFVADRLPAMDGELVVHWADFGEECVRIAAPLAAARHEGTALELPPIEMERWVQSSELSVRGANDRFLSGARAQVRGVSGRGRTYNVGPKPVRVPRLRGPTAVRVEAAGYVAVDLHGIGERADVVLASGSRVDFRPPLSGAHGHRKVVWYWEPLDPEALCGGIASCAQRADADGVFVLQSPGSYRVVARGHHESQFRWEGLLHVPFEPGGTPLWLQDPEGDWDEFLEGVAERSPDG